VVDGGRFGAGEMLLHLGGCNGTCKDPGCQVDITKEQIEVGGVQEKQDEKQYTDVLIECLGSRKNKSSTGPRAAA